MSYEVFDGNRVDVTTVEEIVGIMEARFGLANRVWVMDRGMMSRKNIAWLQKTGRRYVLGASRQEVKRWREQIVEENGWQAVREGVEAKLVRDGVRDRRPVPLSGAAKKETAMHERFALRIEEGLGRLARRVQKARRRLDRSPLERQIGRLLERNSRAAGRYLATLVEDQSLPAGVRLDWSIRPEWEELARFCEGCYVLRTNVNDWNAEALWQTYIQLTAGRGRLPDPQERAVHPPGLAPEEGPSPGAHLRVLPRLRAVEDPRAVAEASGSRQLPADHPRRAGPPPERRHRPADRAEPTAVSSASAASCGPTRPKLSCSTASASASQSAYDCPQTPSKCSANFRTVGGLTH